ncbi:acyl-CoA dehydrogenase family protein [Paludibacterium denitrificans]|uniref:acyl-CoA dehydrogenase family protein n=1 Tax=Paludibacterium denitrificans TaxID=2675226 RepID=UPI00406BA249
MQLDIEEKHPDAEARQDAADLVALLTPVAKAFMTDNGYTAANLGMQVFGGHGFIREWGMEQLVRDCRISQIYEGTNGIQAIDLLGRKVLMDQGQKLRKFTKQIHRFCQAQEGNTALAEFIGPLSKLLKEIGEVTMSVGMASIQNRDEACAAATDYLRLLGHLTYALAVGTHGGSGLRQTGSRRCRVLSGQDHHCALLLCQAAARSRGTQSQHQVWCQATDGTGRRAFCLLT